MAIRCNRVVLCRGQSEKNDTQEAYVKTFETAGYVCKNLPTLRFEFLNTTELRECLRSPDSYFGLVLTSRRAVEAVGLASEGDRDILSPWKQLPAYCVGPATQSFAKNHLGFENCLGSECGNSKDLAEKIVDWVGKERKPLLYPCSEIARETIEQTLNDNRINLKRLVSYKTLASETLEEDLIGLIDNGPRIFVFFSPSTVEYIVPFLDKNKISNIKAVAIGPVTKQALLEAGLKVYATASKPDPVALLAAIREIEGNNAIEKTV